MIYRRESGFSVFFAHGEKKSPERLEIHTRIQKYIYSSQSTTHSAYTQKEGLIIDSYDRKWHYLTVGKYVSLDGYTLSRYCHMGDGVTIDLVEEVDTREEYHDDAQEIGTQQKAHDNHSDDYGCCDSVPFFSSF